MLLPGKELRDTGLRRLWEPLQQGGILEHGFFGLLHVVLQLLQKNEWSPNASFLHIPIPCTLPLQQHLGESLP